VRWKAFQTMIYEYFHTLNHPNHYRYADNGHAFLAWPGWPPGGDGATAIAPLAPAEAVLADAPGRRPGTAQHVWASRGVAAHMADDGLARGLALFVPDSVAEYRANLGGSESLPYLPRRSGE
jgi:hypothetical protein